MKLTDTHCHLYLQDFDADFNEVIQRAIFGGVEKIFLPAIDSGTHQRLFQLCKYSNSECELLPMMGLHPCSINENFETELNLVKELLEKQKFYAIGEIGLDYYWDLSFKEQQIHAFEAQLEWSVAKKLPVAIHSRNSTEDCIKTVEKFNGNVCGIFHCFGGSMEQARQIIELGMYLGIGGVVTYKKTDLREILEVIGLENVVLETDAPYLSPVPHRGKRNEPSFLKLICEAIAAAVGKPVEEVAKITSENAARVFQLN